MINKHYINVGELRGFSTLDSKTAKRVFAIKKKKWICRVSACGTVARDTGFAFLPDVRPWKQNEVRSPHSPGQLKKMPTQDKKKVKTPEGGSHARIWRPLVMMQ